MTAGQYLTGLIVQSIRTPRQGMQQILALGLSRQAIWMGLILAVVLGTLLGHLHEAASPTVYDLEGQAITLPPPLLSTAITFVLLVALDYVVARLGRQFGGTGEFHDILLADVWLRVIALLAMALDIVAYLINPGLGLLVLYATYLFLFWLMLNFVSEAHGGLHLGKTLLVVILSAFITAIPFVILLSMLGLVPSAGV